MAQIVRRLRLLGEPGRIAAISDGHKELGRATYWDSQPMQESLSLEWESI